MLVLTLSGGRFFYFFFIFEKKKRRYERLAAYLKREERKRLKTPHTPNQHSTRPSSPTRPSNSRPHSHTSSSSLPLCGQVPLSSHLLLFFFGFLSFSESVIWCLVGWHLSPLSSCLIRIGLVHFLIFFFLLFFFFGIFRSCYVPSLLGLRSAVSGT